MALTNEFKDSVENCDIDEVRNAVKSYFQIDSLNVEEYQEVINYAAQMDGLFDVHDNEELLSDPAAWTKDYLGVLSENLEHNFSRERLDLLEQVAVHLNLNKSCAEESPKRGQRRSGKEVMFVGFAVGSTGFLISQTSLVVAGIVVLIGGVVLFIVERYKLRKQDEV